MNEKKKRNTIREERRLLQLFVLVIFGSGVVKAIAGLETTEITEKEAVFPATDFKWSQEREISTGSELSRWWNVLKGESCTNCRL